MSVRGFVWSWVLAASPFASCTCATHPAQGPKPAEPAVTQTETPKPPEPPTTLAPKVAEAKTLARTILDGCVGPAIGDYRNGIESPVSPQCPAWKEQLATFGDAIAYAVLPMIVEGGDREAELWNEFMRLVVLKSESPDTVLLLMDFKRKAEAASAPWLPSADEALWQLTQADFVAPSPWSEAPTLAKWVDWWQAHKHETIATWRAAARAKHREDVRAADPRTRYVAIRDLLQSPTDRDAAWESLHEVWDTKPTQVWTPENRHYLEGAAQDALEALPEAERREFLASAQAHHIPSRVFGNRLTRDEQYGDPKP